MKAQSLCLLFALWCGLVSSQCPHLEQGLLRWSEKPEWTTGYTNELVVLDGNYLLDVVTPNLVGLVIPSEFKLVFDHQIGVELRTKYVRLNGELWIGSESCPFEHRTTVTLLGARSSETHPGIPLCGTKTVCLPGTQSGEGAGRLEVHGATAGPAWTRLVATAGKGATTLSLEEPVEWEVGSKIVIATTDFWDDQTEETVVTGVSADGRTVTLDTPLEFMHWGSVDDVVSEQAEVGLLSHPVLFQGDENSLQDQFGGHVMALEGATMRLEGAEFFHMGQTSVLGRYPIHYHLASSVLGGSYVKHSSSYHTFNRCLTVHGTQNLVVEDFVGFDSVGHCIFFEEGAEYDNTLNRVLALNPKVSNLTTSDEEPTPFWITNPRNIITNCAAVGGFFGFWFSLPPNPLGPSGAIYPDLEPEVGSISIFRDNVAHSSSTCFMYEKHLQTQVEVDGLLVQTFVSNGGGWRSDGWSVHERLRAFKCRNRAYWLIGLSHIWKDCQASDSPMGFLIGSTSLVVEGGSLVGYSHNKGNPPTGDYLPDVPATELTWYNRLWKDRTYPNMREFAANGHPTPAWSTRYCGWQQYDNNGPTLVKSVRFHNYFFDGVRPSSAICNGDGSGNVPGGVHHAINLTFTSDPCLPTTLPVYLYNRNGVPTQGQLSHSFIDFDGSVSGMPGQQRQIVANNKFLLTPGCVELPGSNAYSCPPRQHAKLDLYDMSDSPTNVEPAGEYHPTVGKNPNYRVYLYPLSRTPQEADNGYQRIPGMNSYGTGLRIDQVQSLIVTNETYLLVYTYPTPTTLRLTLRYQPSPDYVKLQIPYPTPDPASIHIQHSNSVSSNIVEFSEVYSAEDVNATTWFYDENTGLLHIHLIPWRSSMTTYSILDPPVDTFVHSGTRYSVEIEWKCNTGECCDIASGHMKVDGTACSGGETCWKGFCGGAPAGKLNNGVVHPEGGFPADTSGTSDPYGGSTASDIVTDPFVARFLPDHCLQTNNIRQVGQAWQPAETTIYEGDSVRWILNPGSHNVAQVANSTILEYDGEGFFSGPISNRNAEMRFASLYYQTFNEAGKYYFICEPHAAVGMKGAVTVIPRPEPTVSQSVSLTDGGNVSDSTTLVISCWFVLLSLWIAH